MTRLPRLIPLIALAAALAAPPAAPASATRTLPFAHLSRLDRATSLGHAAPATSMRIGIALQRPDAQGEEAYVRALHDPASPSYHRFLPPAQFRARFGVSS